VLKASYFLGLEQILELRRQVATQESWERWEPSNPLENRADLLHFHQRLLGAPAPLTEVARERFGIELR
jgi:hypothetical protein